MAMLRTIYTNLRPLARPLICVAATLAALAAPLPAQTSPSSQTVVVPSRIVQPVDDGARVTLHGYIHPLAKAANDRGAAPDSTPLQRIHLVLQRSTSQEASLRQLIAGMHTPGDANYHKWLTPAQFGQQFGPSDQDVSVVTSWLASHGFEVTGVKAGKQVIEFNGSVAQMRAAFGTQIHKYVVNGETHYATANEPQIPAALAPVVSGFATLNNFRVKKDSHVLGQASFDAKTHTVKPTWTYGNSNGVNFVVSPQDFGVQYDLPNPLLNAGYAGTKYDGTGQSLAIINDANINIDLVNQFRTLFGLPANPPTVIIDGNDPGVEGINNPDGPNYDSDEAYIDVEWSGAVAPGASVDLVIAADTDLESGLILAAEDAIYSDIAPVLSLSFGACEAGLGSTNIFLDGLTEQAAAQGQTVLVSSGDSGSAACDSSSSPFAVQGVAVSGFASTPWDVAVGGTDFYYSDYNNASKINGQLATYWNPTPSQTASPSLLQRIPEQPWNDSQYGLDTVSYYNDFGFTTIGGGSGGASSAAVCSGNDFDATTGACDSTITGYPKPSWQTGVTGTQADTVRDIPDVSLFASDGSNYSFYPFCYADGDCQPASGDNLVQISGAGGTSFAAPAFAGIIALVNQAQTKIVGSPQSQGQADFVLYPLKAQFPAAFHDVTVGTNAVPCNFETVSEGGTTYPPVNCIAATNPVTYQGVLEGETGTGTTPLYNASAGYNRATGLGTVDAATLIADWNKVTFKTTSVTLTPSSTSFAHGTAITVSGTVTAPGTPSGNVALMTNSSEPANQGAGFGAAFAGSPSTFAVGTNGAYTGSVQDLPGGTYDIWGSYSGDGTNGSSTSPKTSITVTPEASSVYFNLLNSASTTSGSLGISPGTTTVPYGTQGTMDADVFPMTYYTSCIAAATAAASCSTTTYTPPTGTVTFTDNSTTVNTAAVNTEGDAEFNAPYSIGTHTVSASYSGDSSYNKSSSSTVGFTVVQDQPNIFAGAGNGSTTLSNTFYGGQPTVLYVLVENSANYTNETTYSIESTTPVAPPTGTVTVSGLPSGSSSGTATLVGSVDPTDGLPAGVAQFTIPASACSSTCSYTLGVSYGGDTNYTAISESGAITIAPPTPATLLSSTIAASLSGTTITPNQTITVTGTVTGQSGHPAPTGQVYLYPNGEPTTYFNLVPGTGDSSTFTGTLSSQLLTQGGNILTLYYTGDTVYNSSSVVVNSGNAISTPLSDFTLTAASATVPVAAGATGTTTVYVTPTNGFSGTVSLSCAVQGTPTGVSCSVSPGSVTLAYSATASLTPNHERWNLLATGGGAVLAFVLLFTIPARRRAWRNLLSLVVFVCIAGFGIGCGSSGGGGTGCLLNCGGGGGGGGTPGTATNPSQAVTVTVTATSGATVGNYTATITGTAPTDLVHTIGVVAQVQ
jgi:hypothetical protein